MAVRDRKGGYVGGLAQDAFHVFENKQPQPISFFSSQDAPVTVGLLIDSSGSMGPNRDDGDRREHGVCRKRSIRRMKSSSSGFNEDIHTPLPPTAPFTHDVPTLRVALVQAIKAEGRPPSTTPSTRVSEYVSKGSFERQVLVVVSDGGDNASA